MDLQFLTEINSNFWAEGRLKTFKNWPFKADDGICTKERMAAAGFFAIGNNDEPDLVQCFLCHKQLDGWEVNDDPWLEHASHQSTCPYILLNKPDEKQWTLNDLFHLIIEYCNNDCTQAMKEYIKKINNQNLLLVKEIPKLYKVKRNRKTGK